MTDQRQRGTIAKLAVVLTELGFEQSAPERWIRGPFKVTTRTRGAFVGVNLYNRPDGKGSQWCDSWWLETPDDVTRVKDRLMAVL